MILVEDENIFLSNKVIAETINGHFINITKSLHIPEIQDKQSDMTSHDTNSLDELIRSFKHHPSIVKIKQHSENKTTFISKQVSANEISAQIKSLDASKVTGPDQIPAKNSQVSNIKN